MSDNEMRSRTANLRDRLQQVTAERDAARNTLRLIMEQITVASRPSLLGRLIRRPIDPALVASCQRIVKSWERAP